MKKSKLVSFVLITAALASCHRHHQHHDRHPLVWMRADESADYSQQVYYPGPYVWYYAFRPYGSYYGGSYHHAGYYSGSIHESSNVGHGSFKSSVARGGFGGSGHGFSVSS